jgi:hypothetical protein
MCTKSLSEKEKKKVFFFAFKRPEEAFIHSYYALVMWSKNYKMKKTVE